MEYQIIIIFLDNTPSKFRTKDWIEINTTIKNTMLKSSLCDYSDAYVLVKEIISVAITKSILISLGLTAAVSAAF